jgi:hypothetical protein
MKNILELKVDQGFVSLTPPATEEYLHKLEVSLLTEGCQSPIIVWNGIIIDGNKRYPICQRLQIPFETSNIDFQNRFQVISWICRNKLENNQITLETRKYLIGKQYEAEKSNFLFKSGISLLQTHGCNYLVAEKVGEIYHLAANTVYKYGLYANNIDSIIERNEKIGMMILSDTLKISHQSVNDLSHFAAAQLKIIETSLLSGDSIHFTNADIRCSVGRMPGATPQPKSIRHLTELHQREMPIKQTPKFDPDTELSSLMLTIPSWIGSIQRMEDFIHLPDTSALTRDNLTAQLTELIQTADHLIGEMEDKSL